MGASCSLDPGSEEVEECGKRLGESLWASEDLSCSSKMRQGEVACRGSPEWAGPADSQRAVSLDASEPAAVMSNQALVRSTALEDLTRVDDRSSWVNPAEEVIAQQPEEAAAPRLPVCSSEPQSDVLQAELGWRKASERDSLLPNVPSGAAAEKSSRDSSLHPASHSEPDIWDDSDPPSTAVQTTGTAELQKTSPRSSPSRKSLVPVAVFKGLFAVLSPPQLSAPTDFSSRCSCYCVLRCTLPPNSAYGRNNPRRSLLSSLPTSAFGFIAPPLPHCWLCRPHLTKTAHFVWFCSTVVSLCMLDAHWQPNAFSLQCIGRRSD